MHRLLAAALTLALAAACTGDDRAAPPGPSPSAPPAATLPSPSPTPSPSVPPSPSPSPAPGATTAACPVSGYAAPRADRPVVGLAVSLAPDRRSVSGTETVRFTPDRPVTELVFRLWPNAPRTRAAGANLTVRAATVDGRPVERRLGSNGTLLSLPVAVAAGSTVDVRLDFGLTLPAGVNDRMGRSGGTVWFASATPLLAWEHGRGWAKEPATSAFAEATTSEAFRLADLTVEAAADDVVLATGTTVEVVPAAAGRRTHRFRADAVRDVMVAIGRFRVARASAGGVPVVAGVAPGLADSPERIARLNAAAIGVHAARFGPFPYADLDVAVVPDVSGGIEYPGAILLGTRQDDDPTLTHEVAHEWFYGLVGNNQGRDPWLDEAFATYAEALHRGTAADYLARPVPADGRNRVGEPMTYWERHRSSYFRSVYVQGAAMLLRARRRAGAARFDAAIRCYVASLAHRVAVPADLERALAGLPGAVAELRRAGALP